MKKLFFLFILVAIVISVTSCKKTNNSSTTNNVLLSEFIELDTTKAAPNDTLDVQVFQYDNLNRAITSTDFHYTNGVLDIYASGSYTCYYNGTNTVPNKVINSYQDVTAIVDTNYFSFSNSFSKDSSIETSIVNGIAQVTGKSVNETSVNGSFIFGRQASYSGSDSLTGLGFDTVSQTKIDGNVVSQTEISASAPGLFNPGRNATFSFDNHPNPFGGSGNNSISTAHIYDIEADGITEAPQKNNYVDINEPGDAYQSTFHKKYQYTYNANGYPATVTVYDWSSGNPVFNFKGIYIYK